jgi:hypothetical protein
MTPAEKGYSKERSCRRSARVAIAGGGIGGMALALALHDAGFRDVDVSVQWVVGNPTQAPFRGCYIGMFDLRPPLFRRLPMGRQTSLVKPSLTGGRETICISKFR